jgi:hypothetical protein
MIRLKINKKANVYFTKDSASRGNVIPARGRYKKKLFDLLTMVRVVKYNGGTKTYAIINSMANSTSTGGGGPLINSTPELSH